MSRQTALDNISLKPTLRWGHTDYSLEYHTPYLKKVTGRQPEDPDFFRAFYDAWEYDFLFSTNDGLRGNWGEWGRDTDMGHAEYASDGSDKHQPKECPFHTVEEVWAFDAVAEYGLPGFEEQVQAYENAIQHSRERCPNQLTTGGYYRTIVSGAIAAFGWEMLLLGAADPVRMEKVFDSFFRRTLFHMQAWARTSVEVVIQHDDFVWSAGPFMHPEIYRKTIIPRYAELWKSLHQAGKKVLFCSDGNFMEFTQDLAAAGADGFIFEPCNDFDFMVDHFGQTHCLVGSFVDCRDMAFGTWDTVKRTLERTFQRLADCRGAILAVGNHIPANVPGGMLDRYWGFLRENLPRR